MRRHAVLFAGALTVAIAGLLMLRASADGVRVKADTTPSPAPDSAAEMPVQKEKEPGAPAKEGDPWVFYAAGDWRNAAYNFTLARAKARGGEDAGRLELARGAAAFKGATSNPVQLDEVLMETALEAFGNALRSSDAAVREDAHYNLANAIFERAKATEKKRSLAWEKAKSKKARNRHAISLKYLDGLVRQLENSLEHYQETLALNADRSDAETNYGLVSALVKHLREIRKEQAQRIPEGLRKLKKRYKSDKDCEGECEGECENPGSGKRKRSGDAQNDDDSEGDDEMTEGGEDESNEEFSGTPKAAGDPIDTEESEDDHHRQGHEGAGAASEARRDETIRHLKEFSQELPIRPRSKKVEELRPSRDW